MDYEEYKRKALEPIVKYIESAMASYSKEELEARIKKALPEKESEDERIRKELISFVNKYYGEETKKEVLAYLEKQKEQPMELLEPDKNVEKIIEDVIRIYGKTQGEWIGGYDIDTLIVNLRRAFKQKPAEWSEEDEKMFNSLCTVLHGGLSSIPTEQYIYWLKSIRPQPHWKPSEEQMIELRAVISGCSFDTKTLSSLEKDLKKTDVV